MLIAYGKPWDTSYAAHATGHESRHTSHDTLGTSIIEGE